MQHSSSAPSLLPSFNSEEYVSGSLRRAPSSSLFHTFASAAPQVALPQTLTLWAESHLSEDTAPLLAMLALSQSCDAEGQEARDQWRAIHDVCVESDFALNQDEDEAAEEREKVCAPNSLPRYSKAPSPTAWPVRRARLGLTAVHAAAHIAAPTHGHPHRRPLCPPR